MVWTFESGLLGLGFVFIVFVLLASKTAVSVISFLLNIYLQWRYPIRDVSGKHTIKSTPYRFPNGNGNIDKFVHGPQKSEEWHRKYGSIYRIWNGMTPEVVVSTPTAVQSIFKDSDQHAKTKDMGSGYFMSHILGQCVGLLNGSSWRILRKKMDPVMMHSGAVLLIPEMIKMTEDHLDKISILHKESNLLELNPVADFLFLPFFMVATAFYGELTMYQIQWFEEWTPKREKLFEFALLGGLQRFAFSKFIPSDANRRLAEWRLVWAKFNQDSYEESKRRNRNNLLVRLWDDSEIPREQILQTIDESLFANLDVGIGSISWNLVFLACYPDVQVELYNEIISETRNHGWEYYVQQGNTLLEACICESLRLRPIAAFAVSQSAPTNRIADGFFIPAGTDVTVDIYGLNQRNPFWERDPLSYRPARFKNLKASQLRYNFSRFGFGPRQCMGKHMALPMVRLIVAKTIARFELVLEGGYEQVLKNSRGLGTHPNVKLQCKKRTS